MTLLLAAVLAVPALAHDMGRMGEAVGAKMVEDSARELVQEKNKALEEYGDIEGMKPVIEAIPDDRPIKHNAIVSFFRHFLPPRAEAQRIYNAYAQRHQQEKPPSNLNDLSDADLQARLKGFMAKLAADDPAAARRMQALLPRLEAAHNEFMRDGGAAANDLMKADTGSRYLMLDKKGHDDNWTASQPDSPAPLQYSAREKMINGDKRGALEDARRAVELDPGDAKSLALLASAQYDLKNYPAAMDAARAALEIDPDNATANAVVKLARDPVAASVATPASSPTDGALGGLPLAPLSEALTGSLTPAQQESLSLARAAEKDLGVGDDAAAEAAARRAVELSPGYAHGYGLLGFAQARRLELEQALQSSARGLKLNSADRMSHNARMLALNKSARYQEALAAGSAALESGTGGAYARYMNAVARNGLFDHAGALEELRQAGEADARYAELYKAALQLSGDGDMSLLFSDVGRREAPSSSHRLSRTYAVVGGAAAGGLLLGFGLLGLARRRRGDTARPFEPAAAPRLLGGQFSIARRIGQGGMGTVYEGVDLKLQRRVAIKRMRDELRFDEGLRRRFVTEAKLVAALSHPNVVALYSIVDEGEELSLIFEYVQGRTLHDVISSQGKLSFPQALSVLRGVSDALTAAHARGIIHRDLKPSNIMITAEGAPKVMDFGVARAAKDAVSRSSINTPNNTGTIVGTPPYMAPEQEQGVVRLESDVYALAVCVYEALSGELPFGGSAGGMLMNKINKSYTPISKRVSGLPAGLDEVFDRAFEPDADKRYRSVNELRAALEALRVPA